MALNKCISNIRSKILHAKYFIAALGSWINIINMGMLLIVILNQYQINVKEYGIVIFITTLVVISLIGYLLDKIGIYRQENEIAYERIPQLKTVCEYIEEQKKKTHTL